MTKFCVIHTKHYLIGLLSPSIACVGLKISPLKLLRLLWPIRIISVLSVEAAVLLHDSTIKSLVSFFATD